MSRTKLAAIALTAAFATASLATSAYALEPKDCLPMAQMNQALIAEGQRTMIIGDRLAMQNDASKKVGIRVDRYVNTVTANSNGSLGYQLEGDRRRSETSTSVCVAAKLTNIKFFDASRPGVPRQALLGGRIDEVLKESDKIGSRPMVVADSVHPDGKGGYRIGLPLVLSGNVPARSGVIYARQSNGEPVELKLLGDLDYTPTGLQRAQGATALALNAPSAP